MLLVNPPHSPETEAMNVLLILCLLGAGFVMGVVSVIVALKYLAPGPPNWVEMECPKCHYHSIHPYIELVHKESNYGITR